MIEFSYLMRVRRLEMGLTQRCLSRLTGIKEIKLGRIEMRVQDPHLSVALKICDALDFELKPGVVFNTVSWDERRVARKQLPH